eukprot:jgi/Bigna1/142508/aug1.70_g17216
MQMIIPTAGKMVRGGNNWMARFSMEKAALAVRCSQYSGLRPRRCLFPSMQRSKRRRNSNKVLLSRCHTLSGGAQESDTRHSSIRAQRTGRVENGNFSEGKGEMEWTPLNISLEELRPSLTLNTGQSFRWAQREKHKNEFVGVIADRVIIIREGESGAFFRQALPQLNALDSTTAAPTLKATTTAESSSFSPLSSSSLSPLPPSSSMSNNVPSNANITTESLLRDYLNLDIAFIRYRGAQREEGEEEEEEFLCRMEMCFMESERRITGMVDRLCQAYGTKLGSFDGHDFYTFPSLKQLKRATEEELRGMGFGYRAKYIVGTAAMLDKLGGEEALINLRGQSRESAHKFLTQLPGVGEKVASCVCLFSLDKHDDVPVDTHVWQIANRDYGLNLHGKTMTPKVHRQIGEFFRGKFGGFAGWAHHVLFLADLRELKHHLPSDLPDGTSKV